MLKYHRDTSSSFSKKNYIEFKSRNFEYYILHYLQRFSRKSEKIRANFMKISENHDEL